MKHYGDITKINGADVEIVDIVTGGSPCQDLSVAGKRAGLAGERSGLFMEQIRIIKEMRAADESRNRRSDVNIRPRFMVWENVPGAFSSNHGEDFRAVLEETAKVADEAAVIPRPTDGKWAQAGCIMGNGWSIAWRVHDAQFWGVPQRRKRIALVADFGGQTAPEILFERKGVSRDIEPGRTEGQDLTRSITNSVGEAISFQERAGKPGGGKGILIQKERTGALSTLNNQSVLTVDEKMGTTYVHEDQANTLGARDYKQPQAVMVGGRQLSEQTPLVLNDQGGSQMNVTEDQTGTLRAQEHGHQPIVWDAYQHHGYRKGETCGTLTAGQNDSVRGDTPLVCYSQESYGGYAEKPNTATLKQSGGDHGGAAKHL